MRKLLPAFVIIFLLSGFCMGVTPTAKDAGYEYKGTGYLTGIYAVKILLSLAVMSGLAYAAVKLMKKYNLNPAAFNDEIKLKAVKTILGDKKAAIIEARGREYIIAITKDNITLIDSLGASNSGKKGGAR